MATATKTKAFKVHCPKCGALDAAITLDLNDLDRITCGECSEEFTPTEAAEKARIALVRWQAVVRWIDAAREAVDVVD